MEVWAATSSWRGDLKLFARIVEKALNEVRAAGQPDRCSIEFVVRKDRESYASVRDLLDLVPAATVRSFDSSRIRVGQKGFEVEVCFGRKRPDGEAPFSCPFGVSVRVSSDGAVEQARLTKARNAVAAVVARGGFFWSRPPLLGPTPHHKKLEEALAERRRTRQVITQGAFLLVAILLLLGLGLIANRFESENEGGNPLFDPVNLPLVIGALASFPQGISYRISTLIFPAIDIADVTPGRRILQGIGRSGVLTAVVGVGSAFLRTLFQ